MGNKLILKFGTTDVTQYLKRFDLQRQGPGSAGIARYYLDKQAGGLGVVGMAPVQFYRAFDDAGNGIMQRGRLMGGFIAIDGVGNQGTTELYEVACQDNGILFDTIVRDAIASKSITLAAGSFATQVAQLTQIIQRNGFSTVHTPIDTTGVADLHPTMPAVTLPPGKRYGWYIDELCRTAQSLNTALRPQKFLGLGNTFGVADVFGPPVLYIYDGALTPIPVYDFSDTPTGAQKPIWPAFNRQLDSTKLTQRQQSVANSGVVATYQDATSAATYPNNFINHGLTGNRGFWMEEAVEDKDSATFAQMEARLRGQVQPKAYPRETIEFGTDELVIPGDAVRVTWSLIPLSNVIKRVMGVRSTFEPPDKLWSVITLNARRLGINEGTGDEILAAPEESQRVAPLPPGTPSIATNYPVWDATREAWLYRWTWALSATPAVDKQIFREGVDQWDLEPGVTTYDQYLKPGRNYIVLVGAVNARGTTTWSGTLSGTVPAAVNYERVGNPEFELPDLLVAAGNKPADWTSLLTGGVWDTADSNGRIIEWENDPAHVYYGNRSIRIFSPINGRIGIKQSNIRVVPNVPYAIRLRSKAQAALGRIYIFLTAKNASGGGSNNNSFFYPGTAWNLIETQTFTMPADTVTLDVEIGGFLDEAPSTSIWFDSVQLFKGSTSVDIAPTGVAPGTYSNPAAVTVGLDGRLTNIASAAGNQSTVIRDLTNKSGGSVALGDLVVLDTANDLAFTTTNAQASVIHTFGIAQATIANNAIGPVLFVGESIVNSNGVSLTRGFAIYSQNVHKTVFAASVRANGAIGQVVTSGINPRVLLWGGIPLPNANQVFAVDRNLTNLAPLSSFPASPADGAWWLHATHGWCQFRTGVGWLGAPVPLPFIYRPPFTHGQAFSTSPAGFAFASPPALTNYLVTSINYEYNVAAPHDAANRWTFRLGAINAGGGGAVIRDLNSFADRGFWLAGGMGTYTDTGFTNNPGNFTGGNLTKYFTEAIKVGAPGNFTIEAFTIMAARVFS